MKENNHKNIWQSGPDLRIWKKITDRLNKHSKIDAGDIEVEVNKGKVRLKGKADTEEEKQLAEKIAMSVGGEPGRKPFTYRNWSGACCKLSCITNL